MNLLVGMIVYTRIETVNYWMCAWCNATKYANAKLIVIHNYDGSSPPKDQCQNINKWAPDFYWPRKNIGQDIGAFRDLIKTHNYDPWDVLLWCTDDNIPMRKDFLEAFMVPFENDDRMGLVGNYWVKAPFVSRSIKMQDHFRTSCFAIRRNVAEALKFPVQLNSKQDCYKFEWSDPKLCMTNQVKQLGYKMQPICGDWNKHWVNTSEYVWDIDMLNMKSKNPHCRRDHWEQWKAQFNDSNLHKV